MYTHTHTHTRTHTHTHSHSLNTHTHTLMDGAQVVDAIKAFSEGVHPGSAAVPELAESLSGSPFCMYVCIRNTS